LLLTVEVDRRCSNGSEVFSAVVGRVIGGGDVVDATSVDDIRDGDQRSVPYSAAE